VTADRCATAARLRGDPLHGTAAPARRWLLVEHRGPWAVKALDSTGLSHAVATALHEAALATGGRVLLIRRPGRRPRRAVQQWAVVDHDGRQQWGHWRGPEDLLGAAEVMRAGPAPTARDRTRPPLVLVCTHGIHDTCCAVRGRPVAAALAARWPEQTWECTHVGGDRFAPNVLLLPDGACYGDLDESSAPDVVAAHLRGTVTAGYFRGVSTQPPAVQAALAATFARYRPCGLADVREATSEPVGDDTWTVTLHGRGRLPVLVQARVRRTTAPAELLTCRAQVPSSAFRFTVDALRIPSADQAP
jgi:hypothetical protein